MAAKETGKKEKLKITRLFMAPVSLVWKAWTDPALVKRWWGPAGYTAPSVTIDLRAGGKYLYCMRSPDGKDNWSTGTFREIVPMKRIAVTDSFADEKGNVVPASRYGLPEDWPMDMKVTITFAEEGEGMTRFTLRYGSFPQGPMLPMARAGWIQSLDKLARVLAGEQAAPGKTIVIAEPGRQEASMVRVFAAPREKVYRAFTDPDLLAKWWAPRRYETIVDRLELRPGGIWRFLNKDKDGNLFAFHGVYHEISPTRIVSTFEFEGMPGHVLLGITTLEDVPEGTRVTLASVFESVGDRDGMMVTGMSEGWKETFDLLAELVERGAPATAEAPAAAAR